jgi:hypothetical protein
MIYMIKGDNDAARHFFLNLRNIPFQGSTADNLLHLNENPTAFNQDSTCNSMRAFIPGGDLISEDKIFYPELELLLKRNLKNKMAFEYLIAYHLLSADAKGVWDLIPYFGVLHYAKIPRHVQEAIIVIATMVPNFDLNKLKPLIEQKNFNHYVDFRKILMKHKEDITMARQELQAGFRDTYWYYLMFVKSAQQQSDKHNEFQ